MRLWWLPSALSCLAVLGGLTANCFSLLLAPNSLYRIRRLTRSTWQSAEKWVQPQLREGERALGVARIALPAPLHPLHSQIWFGMTEVPIHLGCVYGAIYTIVFAIVGKVMDAPLSPNWQLNLVAFWAFASLTPISCWRGLELLFSCQLFTIGLGIPLLLSKALSLHFQTALTVILALGVALFVIRFSLLWVFPINGLLVITTERVIVLGRVWRRWLILRAIERNLPVRISLTFRTVDALMRWQTGTETFVVAVDLPAAAELKAFISEHFSHWRWDGDALLPTGMQRFKRESVWRLLLLLVLASWSGWVWSQASLRLNVLLKFSKQIDSIDERLYMSQSERQRYLQQSEFTVKLLPDEPVIRAFHADTLFIVGEWEKVAQARQGLPPSDWQRLIERFIGLEKQWRAEVEKRFDDADWRFDLAMAEKFVAYMLKRKKVIKPFVYRAIVWLNRSTDKGASKEVGDIVEFLETAAANDDLGSLHKARRQLQAKLRR